jgi:hypothetical protein
MNLIGGVVALGVRCVPGSSPSHDSLYMMARDLERDDFVLNRISIHESVDM